MYVPSELVRVHHDEMRRHAEIRRLIKQAVADSRGPARRSRRTRIARAAFRLSHPVS